MTTMDEEIEMLWEYVTCLQKRVQKLEEKGKRIGHSASGSDHFPSKDVL